jgi:hypothetical protein
MFRQGSAAAPAVQPAIFECQRLDGDENDKPVLFGIVGS